MRKIFILFLVLYVCLLNAQSRRIGLVNGVAHIGDGRVIQKSLIVINGDKLELVADMDQAGQSSLAFDTLIDLSGQHVYPSLINTNNILGLHDAEAVRATVDFAEVGHINPHVRTLIAYNTDNIIIPTVKTNGVLYTQVTPRGGLISGSSSVMGLEGWNWEDAVLKADDGIHITFPAAIVHKFGRVDANITREAQKRYEEELVFLDRFFKDAAAYLQLKSHDEKNVRFEAMRGVFAGTANLYLHANAAKDIMGAIRFAERHAIKKPVLVGGREAHRVTGELRKHRIPVMLGRLHDLPFDTDDGVDAVYSLPAVLYRDSILFCLQMEGDMEAMQSRNLPFNAGSAVAYGLGKEQALSAITFNAARILGVDHLLGTLEKGKLASLVVSTGDILDMRTNNVTLAFIAGRSVKLHNHQLELYRRYMNKYGLNEK
jgi:hypothetical protein